MSLKIYKSVPFSAPSNSLVIATPFVFEAYQNKRVLIQSLNVTMGTSTDTVEFYAPSGIGKTTVKTAVAASHDMATTAIVLNGDTTADTLNSHLVTTSDYTLLQTDSRDRRSGWGGWQLFGNLTMGGATASAVTIATQRTATPYDYNNETLIRAACSVGNTAYVIDSTEKQSFLVNAASLYLERPFVGQPGAPAVLVTVSTGLNPNYFSGVAHYID